ncbi:MAG TPA: RidA family protein [Gemmatimonadales bacterium]
MSFEIVNPASLGRPSGWSHGLLASAGGRVLFVAGQTAATGGGVATTDFVSQFRLALEKVLTVVRAAGGSPEDVGRFTIYVTDLDVYRASRKPLGVAYQSLMGTHYPAMALVEVKRLVDAGVLVEIEATAVVRDASDAAGA